MIMTLGTILLSANGGEGVFFFFIALALALGVGYMGSKRKIGFGVAFVLALLNLLIGLIAVLCSKKLNTPEFTDADKY